MENFARISEARAEKLKVPVPDPGLVMGYYDADDLPVYDHLAAEYCVVDRWFSSVPGATWPNRLYAMCGQAAGSRDDESVADLRAAHVHPLSGRVAASTGAGTRSTPARCARPTRSTASATTTASATSTAQAEHRGRGGLGKLTEKGSFLDDVADGSLPAVSWIDPRFKDLRVLGPDSNDDHPPSDVLAGQDLILTIYHALSANAASGRRRS